MRNKRTRNDFFCNTLEELEEKTINFIKGNEPPEGYLLAFSGGKDSCVLYDLTKRSGVKFFPLYTCTTVDPPELTRFIRRNYPEVNWCFPKKSLFKLMKENYTIPTRVFRWCCEDLKEFPSFKGKLRQYKNRLIGVRAEESFKRSQRKMIDVCRKPIKYNSYNAILYWREFEIWEYIEKYNIPCCKLYDVGFNRIGCVVCPFIFSTNSKNLKHHKERWPNHYKKFEEACYVVWEKRYKDVLPFDVFMKNYYSGKKILPVEEEEFLIK